MKTEAFPVEGLFCACCGPEIEAAVAALPGVHHARMRGAGGQLEVMYEETTIARPDIKRRVREVGYRCGEGEPTPNLDHLTHQAELGPIALGHPADHMQYEMRGTSAGRAAAHSAHAATAAPAAEHAGHAPTPPRPPSVPHRNLGRRAR
jgi:cation transport ATPase